MNRFSHRAHGEDGATLIFVIGFMVVVGLVGAGLATQLSSSSKTRVALDKQRNREYSADAAILKRIGEVREHMESTDAIEPCPGPTSTTRYTDPSDVLNDFPIQVDCQFDLFDLETNTELRNATFTACAPQEPGEKCPDSATIIRAQVHYERDGECADNPDDPPITCETILVRETQIRTWSVNS